MCILAILKGKQRDWRQPVPTDEEEADMLKLWIVGASGQIGSAINEVLDPLEMEVFNTDKEELDITDTDEVLNFGVINRPDVIINCAAVTDTDLCEKEPELRHGGAYYHISLGACYGDHENYYLIGYDSRAEQIRHYRVDKMLHILLSEEIREGKEEFQKIDMASYSKKSFGMFGGKRTVGKTSC